MLSTRAKVASLFYVYITNRVDIAKLIRTQQQVLKSFHPGRIRCKVGK